MSRPEVSGAVATLEEQQRAYYAQTADSYDAWHVAEDDEHFFALNFLLGCIDHYGIRSILDVGSGTGRAIQFLKRQRPELHVVGIEPVRELREVGYRNGLTPDQLREGNALVLPFRDGEFDLVCEFGVLHHIRTPELAVSEMLRVGQCGIFLSDSNNFGQGSRRARTVKQIFNALRLWKLADLIKTRGKGYTYSEGDGIAYSYSIFNDYAMIRKVCKTIHLVNLNGTGPNLYRDASHVALFGLKRPCN